MHHERGDFCRLPDCECALTASPPLQFRKYLNLKPFDTFEEWNPDPKVAAAVRHTMCLRKSQC